MLPWLLGRFSHQLRRSCASAYIVYLQKEREFILEHYLHRNRLKLFVKPLRVCKEVPNKTTLYQLITKRRDVGSVCDKCLSSDIAENTALPFSSSEVFRMQYLGLYFKRNILYIFVNRCYLGEKIKKDEMFAVWDKHGRDD
jgi:hypothetical protein